MVVSILSTESFLFETRRICDLAFGSVSRIGRIRRGYDKLLMGRYET